MAEVLDRLDAFQRRHPVLGFPFAVIYKFFDDQGNYLAAILTYYAFISIFPMLLIASSILGFVLQGNHRFEQDVLHSALSQFPIVGTQLGQPEGLRGSTSAILFGTLTALYGTVGLGQAAQNAVNVTLAIPRNSRLNPLISRLRSLLLLLVAGVGVLALTVLTSLASHTQGFGLDLGTGVRWLLRLVSMALTAIVLGVMTRFASPNHQRFRDVIPGATVVALLWQLLQSLGGLYVAHVVTKSGTVNSIFALVLGLVALLYLASTITILGLEINVVASNHFYPRALLTPFTDAVDLTDADRRLYTGYARAQRHKGFEHISVEFKEPD